MRRVLILIAGLLAVSCSHGQRTKEAARPADREASVALVSSIPELAPREGERVVAQEVGGLGKPDLWRYYVLVGEGKEQVVRKERDLNGDGRVDLWEAYDPEGNVTKQAYDLDFDSKPDLVITFEKGQLVKKEYAPGFDGMVRTTAFYENGKLVRKERDSRGTGKTDTWEYWENGQLDRLGVDLDGDGEVDRWDKRSPSEGGAAPSAPSAPPSTEKEK